MHFASCLVHLASMSLKIFNFWLLLSFAWSFTLSTTEWLGFIIPRSRIRHIQYPIASANVRNDEGCQKWYFRNFWKVMALLRVALDTSCFPICTYLGKKMKFEKWVWLSDMVRVLTLWQENKEKIMHAMLYTSSFPHPNPFSSCPLTERWTDGPFPPQLDIYLIFIDWAVNFNSLLKWQLNANWF